MSSWIDRYPFREYTDRIETTLESVLPTEDTQPITLHKAMRYSVFNGGKRMRPLLVYTIGQMLDVPLSILDYCAAAIELIHCYSLVHDDLPAMDDADLRRGKPSCHKAFDQATAILAGDALQSLAFQILVDCPNTVVNDKQRVSWVKILASCIGSLGMAGGQMYDLESLKSPLSLKELEKLHQLKTGRLFAACFDMPMIAADVSDPLLCFRLETIANHIGLAFQVQDDILDVEATTDTLGKQQGQDQQLNKTTFATIMPITEAKAKLQDLFDDIYQQLDALSLDCKDTRNLIEHLATRQF